MKHLKKAFTLVELIVVITILAILGAIAFISLQGYSSESRDSKRISDLGQIRTGLQIEQAREGELPTPDDYITIGSGSTVYLLQGYAGTGTLNKMRVSDDAKDPVEDNYYTYTITADKTKFQLVAMAENEDFVSSNTPVINTTYSNYENRVPYVVGFPLGSLLEINTKRPIQELGENIDLSTNNEDYIPVFTRDDSETSYSGELLLTKILENFNYSCSSQPSYSNANFIGGGATKENQAWQNVDASQGCYYECTNGYTGEQCEVAPNCAPQPSYSNTNFIAGTPTEDGKTWQNTNDQEACYYECTNGYTGEQCEIEPICEISYQEAQNDKNNILANINDFIGCEINDYPGTNIPGNGTYIAGLTNSNNNIIVVSKSDIAGGKEYGCYGITLGSTSVTDGVGNTTIIKNSCAQSDIGAKSCRAIGSNWYLPSEYELNTIFTNKSDLGSFGIGYYRSSTESSTNNERAYKRRFGDGNGNYYNKDNIRSIRCSSRF